jgi:hypothetical protein
VLYIAKRQIRFELSHNSLFRNVAAIDDNYSVGTNRLIEKASKHLAKIIWSILGHNYKENMHSISRGVVTLRLLQSV